MALSHKLRKPVGSRQALRSRKKALVVGVFLALGVAGVLAFLLVGCGGGTAAACPFSAPGGSAAASFRCAKHRRGDGEFRECGYGRGRGRPCGFCAWRVSHAECAGSEYGKFWAAGGCQ